MSIALTPDDLVQVERVYAETMLGATPPPALTVSEWAEAHRILPESSAARGARWRNDTAPYLAGLMDCILEPTVKRIAIMGSAQCGKTSTLENITAYCMAHRPAPILIVFPTDSDAEEFSKTRLVELINSTESLRRVVREERALRTKDAVGASTLRLKIFPGGYLALGGSNSPNAFARRAVRLAIGDDVDRWPAVVGDEGDPAELLTARTITFYNGITLFCSTPNLKGGRIETLYLRSDRRRYFVPCPSCGHRDWLTWNDATHFRIAFDERDPSTARLECPRCQAPIADHERTAMMAHGVWAPTEIAAEPGLIGFHVWAAMSPWVALKDIVTRFLAAREGGQERLKPFFNTVCGEPWEDRSQRMDSHWLWSRRENYGDNVEVPGPAVCLTAGVDIQADRCELLVMGWGPGGERWVIDYGVVPGALKHAETKASLLEVLSGTYVHASGARVPIHGVCIDSGYDADEVYTFVLANQHRRIFATKGVGGRSGEPIVGKATEKRWGQHPRPVRLYPINVDDAKAEIRQSLILPVPGPGAMHFPAHVDAVNEEFFAQLCAEHRETQYNKAGVAVRQVWVQDRPRNEALDAAVLALAAFRLLSPNLHGLAEKIRLEAERVVLAKPEMPVVASWLPPTRQDWLERSVREMRLLTMMIVPPAPGFHRFPGLDDPEAQRWQGMSRGHEERRRVMT